MLSIIRVTSSTGWTLDDSMAPWTMPGDCDRRGWSVRYEIGSTLGTHLHRIIWPDNSDLANLSVLRRNGSVSGDRHLRICWSKPYGLAIDVQDRIATAIRQCTVWQWTKAAIARQPGTVFCVDCEISITSKSKIKRVGSMRNRARLRLPVCCSILRIDDGFAAWRSSRIRLTIDEITELNALRTESQACLHWRCCSR